jgi:multiple sugar transport system substrate-binding protein
MEGLIVTPDAPFIVTHREQGHTGGGVDRGGDNVRARTAAFAAVLLMAPFGARAADLAVWWEKGFYPEEDEAVAEVIAAFEEDAGKQVELVHYPQAELPEAVAAAIDAGKPPDVAFGGWLAEYIPKWAFDDRLVDLSEVVGSFSDLFDPEALERVTLLNGNTGQEALYALPMGRSANHVHVWTSLLARAGFDLADIPREWEAFWSFWCDQVQPAVRRATGRNDIWGIGLPMSSNGNDTTTQFLQFLAAYEADYVTRDGKLIIDDPEIRGKLVHAISSYTAYYLRTCTPPDSITWENIDNNKQFYAQAVVMTPNDTLSIPNGLKSERPEDYYENTATIEWPLGPRGDPFPIMGEVLSVAVFKGGGSVASAEAFVRFLVAEGWLAHYLNFSAERFLPPMPKLLEQPFWLDPSDPHRMAAVMQVSSRPLTHNYTVASGDWRHDRAIWQERVWAKAIHRIVTEGVTAEQAVDEAIARVKQILSE